ncbi:hypothetical protein [Rickettsiella massiliensis]|uniref:hypothetical protein n=1 Tax=Rickettsiella massiliensis TaxID=676517 RepID=UPI00030E8708|nr:hypothetical protein [Rickettsiella massiliensis]
MELHAKINGLEKHLKQHPTKRDFSIVNVISMDQPSQRGEKFEAFTRRINLLHKKRGVRKLVIILTDSLQEHYLGLNPNLVPTNIKRLAHKKGTDWIRQNSKSLSFCLDPKVNIEIWRWKKLLSCDDFKKSYREVEQLYEQDKSFQEIVNRLSGDYAQKLSDRRKNWKNPPSPNACFAAAKNYLLEESAIWGPLLNLGFDFITYPGCKNEAVNYTYDKLSQSINQFLPWLRYSFEKKRSLPSLVSKKLIDPTKSIENLYFPQFFSKIPSDNLPEDFELLELEESYQGRRLSL